MVKLTGLVGNYLINFCPSLRRKYADTVVTRESAVSCAWLYQSLSGKLTLSITPTPQTARKLSIVVSLFRPPVHVRLCVCVCVFADTALVRGRRA